MRLLWLTARRLGSDLASTTELNLASGLVAESVDVTLISPGKKIVSDFQHIAVKKGGLMGFETYITSKGVAEVINSDFDLDNDFDLILVDWRLIFFLRRILTKTNKWAIIDRGPPAYSGSNSGKMPGAMLGRIQRWFWKRGWEIATKYAKGGFVVSELHKELVKRTVKTNLIIGVIKSGSSTSKPTLDRAPPGVCLRLAYVGRVDSKRGVEKIFRLSEDLSYFDIDHEISVAGEGDFSERFDYLAKKHNHISFLGKIDHIESMKLQSKNHVGIMPMPDIEIWRIASPIKLAEYLSSGLAIIGPNHAGNCDGRDGEWNLLSDDDDWTKDCAKKLSDSIAMGNWKERIEERAIEASNEINWQLISGRLRTELELMSQVTP